MFVENPNLANHSTYDLYHLGLGFNSPEKFSSCFGDLRIVLVCGSNKRAEKLASAFFQAFQHLPNVKPGSDSNNLSKNSDRYKLFKIGSILICSHGMGNGSASILMNEVLKLLHVSKCSNVKFIRLGTCGGLGHEPGTIAVTKNTVDPRLRDGYHIVECGEEKSYHTSACEKMNGLLRDILVEGQMPHVFGTTMTTDDFYEGQARLDGAFCNYGAKEKKDFMWRAHVDKKVQNIEMEASTFLGFCNRGGVEGCVLCLILVNRLESDCPTLSPAEIDQFLKNLIDLTIKFVTKLLEEN